MADYQNHPCTDVEMAYVNNLAKIAEEGNETIPEEPSEEGDYQELVDFQKVELPEKKTYDTLNAAFGNNNDEDYHDRVEFTHPVVRSRPRTPTVEPLPPAKRIALQHVILVVLVVLIFIVMIAIIGFLASQLVNDNDEQKTKISTLQQKLIKQEQTMSLLQAKVNRSFVNEIDQLQQKVTSMKTNQSNVWDVISEIQCGICIRRVTTTNPRGYYCDCQQLKAKKDCLEFYQQEYRITGIYRIHQNHRKVISVYCDQNTDGGGWTVIQRRSNGKTEFNRNWATYVNGFGDLHDEFWLGNQHIFTLALQGGDSNVLRIEVEDWDGVTAYARYDSFKLSDSDQNYKLSLGEYKGTAGDSMKWNKDQPFSAKDKDNDIHPKTHCAQYHKGGWWYRSCTFSCLNGKYYNGPNENHDGVVWYNMKEKYYSMKRAEMKVRRKVI